MNISDVEKELEALREENKQLKKQLEEATNQIQDLEVYKTVLDNVSDCVICLDNDANFIYANKHLFKEHHVSTDDIKSKKAYELSESFNSKDEFLKVVNHIKESGEDYSYTAIYKGEEGHPRTYKVTAFASLGKCNKEKYWFFMRDVTDLVNSRDELSEVNYLMETIINNVPVYIFVKDIGDGFRYLCWNKAFAEHSGIPASKVIGNTDYEVFPDQADAEKFRRDDLEVVESGETLETHETYMAVNGERRIVKTQKYRVNREGRSPLLLGVCWDITDMQDIEQQLIQERIRAEQSDRLKSAFLANMSHEIRTPLNAIVGFSQLLTEENTPEDDKMYSDIIRQNAEMLLQLINDILDLSKIEAGTLEYVRRPMDLADVCHSIFEMQKDRVNRGVELVLDNPDDSLIINEDRNRVTQVLTNFVNNAIKFTTEGEIRIGYKIEGEMIEAYVKDTGKGIAPDKLDSVFERFVKLDTFAQGTGLGLSICKMIAGKMNGDVKVESELGKGSKFTLLIPYKGGAQRVATKAQAAEPAGANTAARDENAMKTILVAEDVESNFFLLRSILGKKYNLVWVRDGEAAVKYFKENQPDLILMDIKMPVMNGLDATRIIRTISRTIPIIALTAFAFDSDKDRALEAGCDDFLTKPVSKQLLLQTLDKFLQKNYPPMSRSRLVK